MTNAVKFVDGTDNIIEGLAIPFGGPIGGKDRHGEKFVPGTDLALDWFPEEGRPTLYQHGLDPTIKTELVGRQISRELVDEGHWVKVQLDKRSKHLASLAKLVEEEALSFSSGAVPHLVVTGKDGTIERWPWTELSLTPTPANDAASVYAVKTADAIEHLAASRVTIPDALKQALDEWPGAEPDLDDLIEAASAKITNLIEQASHHAGVRAKASRGLSAATRTKLTGRLENLEEMASLIRDLLAADPAEARQVAEKAAQAAAIAEAVRYQQQRYLLMAEPQ